mmetsp:Transcript_48683/g.139783  ORF Transcript_48683/g.139783 Transcript_48683/m.139783 type:complete len:202 (-) Transcript_48683:49-654(-)
MLSTSQIEVGAAASPASKHFKIAPRTAEAKLSPFATETFGDFSVGATALHNSPRRPNARFTSECVSCAHLASCSGKAVTTVLLLQAPINNLAIASGKISTHSGTVIKVSMFATVYASVYDTARPSWVWGMQSHHAFNKEIAAVILSFLNRASKTRSNNSSTLVDDGASATANCKANNLFNASGAFGSECCKSETPSAPPFA